MFELTGRNALILSALGWAAYDLMRRELSRVHPPWLLVAGVTLLALSPLGLVVWWLESRPPSPEYWAPALLSVLFNVAANYGFFQALSQSGMAATLPMLSLTPLLAALLGRFVGGEPVEARLLGGALLAVLGGLLLGWQGEGLRWNRGSALMLGVAVFWSFTLLLDRKAVGASSPWVHALVLHSGVALGSCVVLASRRELGRLSELRRTPGLLLAGVGVGALALVLQLEALMSVPVGWVETVKRAVGGVVALAGGAFLYGEPVGLRHVLAVSLLLFGFALALL